MQIQVHDDCSACATFEYNTPSGKTERIVASREPDLVIPFGEIRALLVFSKDPKCGAASSNRKETTEACRLRIILGGDAERSLLRLQGTGGAGALVMLSVQDRPIAVSPILSLAPWELRAGEFPSLAEIQELFATAPMAPVVLPIDDPLYRRALLAIEHARADTRWLMACDPEFRREVLKKAAEEGHPNVSLPSGNKNIDCSRKPPSVGISSAADPHIEILQGAMVDGAKDGLWTHLNEQGTVTKLELFENGKLIQSTPLPSDP